ncbi:hypothetical protein KY331_03685 [Candidatus Woesearchaeota archaeon]|nr:hypothetical protein [Candidatus Woesearchaeota archaeon]
MGEEAQFDAAKRYVCSLDDGLVSDEEAERALKRLSREEIDTIVQNSQRIPEDYFGPRLLAYIKHRHGVDVVVGCLITYNPEENDGIPLAIIGASLDYVLRDAIEDYERAAREPFRLS